MFSTAMTEIVLKTEVEKEKIGIIDG